MLFVLITRCQGRNPGANWRRLRRFRHSGWENEYLASESAAKHHCHQHAVSHGNDERRWNWTFFVVTSTHKCTPSNWI